MRTLLTLFLGNLPMNGFHIRFVIVGTLALNAENKLNLEIVTVGTVENNCSKHAQNAEKNCKGD